MSTVIEPDRIAKLPKDKRGYPIPWNVTRDADGEPLFTVNNDHKHWQALREALCPICGETLEATAVWIGGPQSAFHPKGTYFDLPAHCECAHYALQVCPYLAARHWTEGRVTVPKNAKLPEGTIFVDHTQIPGRPQLLVAVFATAMTVQLNEPPMLPYNCPVKPVLRYEFWRDGEQIPAHRAMPVLRGIFGADFQLPATQLSL